MRNYQICFIGLSLLTFAFEMSVSAPLGFSNCTKVFENPPLYPLSVINQCDQVLNSSTSIKPRSYLNCPKLTCKESCIFGRRADMFGCLTCECKTEGMFEGDIILSEKVKEYIKRNYVNPSNVANVEAKGATNVLPLWKMYPSGNNYIIPYDISSSIGYNGRKAIEAAVKDFEQFTCIRLKPRTVEAQFIEFFRGPGCYSNVGAIKQKQQISLGYGCWYKGTVIHEILHALGFWHEQSRPDRDNHVRIRTENIEENAKYNFNKFSKKEIDSLGSAYDVGSVMHYSSYAFTSNGQPTITDLNGKPLVTQRNGFAQSDIEQLNKLYGCKETGNSFSTFEIKEMLCKDTNKHCEFWASNGECQRTPGFMNPNCCKSCQKIKSTTSKLITTTTTTTTTTTQPTTTTKRTPTTTQPIKTTTKSSCVDKFTSCKYIKPDQCTKTIKSYCCQSCKNKSVITTTTEPTTTKPKCKDNYRSCPDWSKKGYCKESKYNFFMTKHCQSSCEVC